MPLLSRDNLAPRVFVILREQLGIPLNSLIAVDEECSIIDDLAADSLDYIEIAFACEDEFGIELADVDMEEVETVGELIDLIVEKEPVA